ncbi:MAG: hypothetical protein U1C96_01945 [Gallionella sp.]|nr:hypothetical protein [Gallionella sp.]
MGFVVLMAMGVYLLISLGVVAWAISHAKKNGKSAKKWGWGAALVMYMIPFWDWIPTVAVHQFYCAKDSGFWVYKTLEQWKVENPGVMETLTTQRVPPNKFERGENFSISTTSWNARINSTHTSQGELFLNLWRREDKISDVKTGEMLAMYVDFSTSQVQRQAGWSGWKFWLDSQSCIGGRDKAIQFVKFVEQFKGEQK